MQNIASVKLISTKEIVLVGLSIALITLGAYLHIQIFTIAFTFQLMMIMLISGVFSPKVASISTLIYVLMGLAGLPVFSKGGGIGYVLTPGFGYLVGFILAAIFISFFAGIKKATVLRGFLINCIALAIVYLLGASYWYILANYILASQVELSKVLYFGVLVFVPKDLFLAFIAALASVKIKKIIKI